MRFIRSILVQIGEKIDDTEKRNYRESLVKRRRFLLYLKLFANALFLISWTLIIAVSNDSTEELTVLRSRESLLELKIYAAVAVAPLLFSLIGCIRRASLVSQVWFEVAWFLGVVSIDCFLLYSSGRAWPPFGEIARLVFDDPFLYLSLFLHILAVVGLGIDLLASLFWSGSLWVATRVNTQGYPFIWVSHAAEFPWLCPQLSDLHFSSGPRLLVGHPREPPLSKASMDGLKRWLLRSTVFRRWGDLEPQSHCILRGVFALTSWSVLLAYAIIYCAINPFSQFTELAGLPTRSLSRDTVHTESFGRVIGFLALGTTEISPEWEGYYNESLIDKHLCKSIEDGMHATYTFPGNGTSQPCKIDCHPMPLWENEVLVAKVSVIADCDRIWDSIGFRKAPSVSVPRPYVIMTWNSSAYLDPDQRTLSAGLATVDPNDPPFVTISNTFATNPWETENGVTFDFAPGQTLRVQVGRRRRYSRSGSTQEMFGFSRPPSVMVTYPILSWSSEAVSSDPRVTEIRLYPAFGPFNDEIDEEYLNYTVLSGLAATGGLYTALDVLYTLLFGRSLLTTLFGGKHIAPFGAISSFLRPQSFRRQLQNGYPGIDGVDPVLRAQATCDFLHDFILDLTPLKINPTYEKKNTGSNVVRLNSPQEGSGAEPELELRQRMEWWDQGFDNSRAEERSDNLGTRRGSDSSQVPLLPPSSQLPSNRRHSGLSGGLPDSC